MFVNFLTLSAGEAIARGLHAVAILLLVRFLRPDSVGIFELAVSITAYAVLAVQQGFDPIAIREVARHHDVARNWLWALLRLRVALALPVIVLLAGVSYTQRDNALGLLLPVFCVWCLTAALTPRWLFLAMEKSRAPAFAGVLAQSIFLTVTAVWVRSPGDITWAAIGWVGGESLAVLYLWMNVFWLDLPRTSLPTMTDGAHHTIPSRRNIFRASWPVALTSLMGQMMFNFDVLALAAMGRRGEIGLYLAAYRCFTVFSPILVQFQSSLLAHLVRLRARGFDIHKQAKTAGTWSVAGALIIALSFSAFAPGLLRLLFGSDYASAAIFLRILIWALPLQVVRLIARQILIIRQQQLADTRNSAFGAGTNVLLDLALIPSLGSLGCAISTLSSAAAVMLAQLRSVRVSKDL